METSRLTQDGTAEPFSRNQILRRDCGQGNIHFPCSADHVQDYWQPHTLAICVCVTIYTLKVDFFLDTSNCFIWAHNQSEVSVTTVIDIHVIRNVSTIITRF